MTQSYRTVTKTREMNTEYGNSSPHQDRTHYSSQNHGPTRHIKNVSQQPVFKSANELPDTEATRHCPFAIESQNNPGWKGGPYPNSCSKQD